MVARAALIPTSSRSRIGSPAGRPSWSALPRVAVSGAVERGVAVAPSIPPEPVGLAAGLGARLADDPALELALGDGLGEALGPFEGLGLAVGLVDGEGAGDDGLGEGLELGGGDGLPLGVGEGVALGVGDGQAGTVIRWMIEPSENTIMYVAGGTS
jgi:hypothetical protein